MKGYILTMRGPQRVLKSNDGKHIIFDVELISNVLTVCAQTQKRYAGSRDVIFAATGRDLGSGGDLSGQIQKGSLIVFYKRLGHLNYDAIERLPQDLRRGTN